jgi:outer membrane murein-binding lipoprotein Lpp
MEKLRKSVVLLLAAAALGTGIGFSGCTSYATPEQLARIAELEREINALESTIQTKQSQIGTLDRQISAQEAKLEQCAKDKELVKQRLANWQGN